MPLSTMAIADRVRSKSWPRPRCSTPACESPARPANRAPRSQPAPQRPANHGKGGEHQPGQRNPRQANRTRAIAIDQRPGKRRQRRGDQRENRHAQRHLGHAPAKFAFERLHEQPEGRCRHRAEREAEGRGQNQRRMGPPFLACRFRGFSQLALLRDLMPFQAAQRFPRTRDMRQGRRRTAHKSAPLVCRVPAAASSFRPHRREIRPQGANRSSQHHGAANHAKIVPKLLSPA